MIEITNKNGRAEISRTAQVYGQNKSENPLFSDFFESQDGVFVQDIARTCAEHSVTTVQNPCSERIEKFGFVLNDAHIR